MMVIYFLFIMKIIKTLLEIDTEGQYQHHLNGEIVTVDKDYDDNDKPFYIVYVGNYLIMKGWNPKKWKTISGLRQSLMDYATYGEHYLDSWSSGRL